MSTIPDPVTHWFYRAHGETYWKPFSHHDSCRIEKSYQKSITHQHSYNTTCRQNRQSDNTFDPVNKCHDPTDTIVSTDGGRYDVYVNKRIRKAIYWDEEDSAVLRGTWCYRRNQGQVSNLPFEEEIANILESRYQQCCLHDVWDQHVELPNSQDVIIFHNPSILKYYTDYSTFPDDYSNIDNDRSRGGDVSRGIVNIDYEEEGESTQPDHLLFIVHGIGEFCDFRFRSLIQVVDDFRIHVNNAIKIQQQQNCNPNEQREGRIELLPVSWHSALHGGSHGIDERLSHITLKSIPKLRGFSNDTIMDALLYTSPVYHQHIMRTVASEILRIFQLFKTRNSNFSGTVSLMGHSLGSLILYDILSHQDNGKIPIPHSPSESVEKFLQDLGLHNLMDKFRSVPIGMDDFMNIFDSLSTKLDLPIETKTKFFSFLSDLEAKNLNFTESPSSSRSHSQTDELGTSQSIGSILKYPKLNFKPLALFAIGSPIPVFLTVRGVKSLPKNFKLPTCDHMYNIFHPYDPIAYRFEPLFDPSLADKPPVQIPHHKGRKRIHLQIRDNLERMTFGIKEKIVESIRPFWDSIYAMRQIHQSSSSSPSHSSQGNLSEDGLDVIHSEDNFIGGLDTPINPSRQASTQSQSSEFKFISQMNNGGRIDFVLQEKPIEILNEYIFALAAHACYWQSEDTALFIVREIYKLNGS